MTATQRQLAAAALVLYASVALNLLPSLRLDWNSVVPLAFFIAMITAAYVLALGIVETLYARLASTWTLVAAIATTAVALTGFAGIF